MQICYATWTSTFSWEKEVPPQAYNNKGRTLWERAADGWEEALRRREAEAAAVCQVGQPRAHCPSEFQINAADTDSTKRDLVGYSRNGSVLFPCSFRWLPAGGCQAQRMVSAGSLVLLLVRGVVPAQLWLKVPVRRLLTRNIDYDHILCQVLHKCKYIFSEHDWIRC